MVIDKIYGVCPELNRSYIPNIISPNSGMATPISKPVKMVATKQQSLVSQ
jgi:hypothetical protein